MRSIDAMLLQPLAIFSEVLTHCAHDTRTLAQKAQVIGNIAGTATSLPPHRIHEEAYIEHMKLIRQDMVFEVAGEDHNLVVG
jgi:hypothetical protein